MKLFNDQDLKILTTGKNKGNISPYQQVLLQCDRCNKTFNRTYGKLKENHFCKSCTTTLYNKNRPKEVNDRMILAARATCLGKTLEEICGIEKATKMKLAKSKANSGSNNPNFGGIYSRGFADHPITGTLEENYGVEKATKMKLAKSKANSGSNNPMFGKPSPNGSGNGWSGWFNGYFFRSLLELSFMILFEKEGIKFKTGEKFKDKIPYNDNGKIKNYFPDFILEDGRIIEIKPTSLVNTYSNILKFNAAKEKFGEKFIVLTEKDCVKIVKTELIKLIESKKVVLMSKYMEKLNANNS